MPARPNRRSTPPAPRSPVCYVKSGASSPANTFSPLLALIGSAVASRRLLHHARHLRRLGNALLAIPAGISRFAASLAIGSLHHRPAPVNRPSKLNGHQARTLPQPVDLTNFPGLAPVSSPFSKIGTPEQIVMS